MPVPAFKAIGVQDEQGISNNSTLICCKSKTSITATLPQAHQSQRRKAARSLGQIRRAVHRSAQYRRQSVLPVGIDVPQMAFMDVFCCGVCSMTAKASKTASAATFVSTKITVEGRRPDHSLSAMAKTSVCKLGAGSLKQHGGAGQADGSGLAPASHIDARRSKTESNGCKPLRLRPKCYAA